MEVSTSSSALYRDVIFNALTVTIYQGLGLYSLFFHYANMRESCSISNDIEVWCL